MTRIMATNEPFWRTKTLAEMSETEWESLCDGCGQCCRIKLEDADSGDVVITHFSCTLLDTDTCRCTDYPNRRRRVPSCLRLTPDQVLDLPWLPDTCAYVKVARGEELEDWHHLVSGSHETVHEAGFSVRGQVRSEAEMKDVQEALAEFFGVDWDDDAT